MGHKAQEGFYVYVTLRVVLCTGQYFFGLWYSIPIMPNEFLVPTGRRYLPPTAVSAGLVTR